ncbi:hypothetical protein C0991_009638 [Blastosporella zonata]|nr:hypothetical protein C0991_009638 [Blastosporella zonata]
MRTTSSQHTESIRSKASDIWPNHGVEMGDFRPQLNLEALSELLQIATSNDTSNKGLSREKGKKRSNMPSVRTARVSKRVKVADGAPSSAESEDFDWHAHVYPKVDISGKNTVASKDVQTIPVLQHVFEIQYTREGNEIEGWKVEEENILEILTGLEPRTIDLGDVDFTFYHNHIVAFSPQIKHRFQWCLLLPSHHDLDLAWHGLTSGRVQDVLVAAAMLRPSGRTNLRGRLKIVVLGEGELPFRLEIETDLLLRVPTIFEGFPWSKGKVSDVEEAQRLLLAYLYPSGSPQPKSYDGVTDIPFFYSILQPAPQLEPQMQEVMQPEELLPTLLPFQRRSVAWLLGREGKMITTNGKVVPKPHSTPFSFWECVEEGNATWYLNRLSGALSPSPPEVYPALGGILAEEPGLGKTLESIALILLNPAPIERNPSVTRWDPEAQLAVRAIKTTLIVTPPALASQWADELASHAPTLKVLKYDGWSKVPVPVTMGQVEAAKRELLKKKSKPARKSIKRRIGQGNLLDSDDDMDVDEPKPTASEEVEIQDWCSYVHEFDVVITTYSVLRSDFNVALAAPVRPRREDVVYSKVERTRSPLIMVEWYRVIMDEVQMVGGGKIEDMVSLIPRHSSFAVSGTPARQQVPDLMHVLKFLRVDDVVGSARLWSRLTSTGFGAAPFAALFQATLKANVKDELTIPEQTRYLVGVNLGPVEKHVYDQALEAALQDLGLDARGVAGSDGWQIDGTVLRSAIRRLRGICTHPQVGQLQRPGDKLFKPGRVKTIGDVLQNMRDTNWRTMMDSRKSKVQALIRVAQLQTRDENDPSRFRHALYTLIDAEKEAQSLVDEAQAALNKYVAKKRNYKDDAEDGVGGPSEKAKGKQRQISEEPSDLSDIDDYEDEDLLNNTGPKGKDERAKKRSALQNRLRECRITLHRAKFLQGDLYHGLGADHAEDESAAYGAAETIRRSLLKGVEEDATRTMSLLTHDADKKNITKDALMVEEPLVDDSDLFEISENNQPTKQELKIKPVLHKVTLFKRVGASINLTSEVNDMIEEVLNAQSALLWEWRTHLVSLLTLKLASSEDSPDGDEYQRTLDSQGDVETYLKSYAALLKDRRQALTDERTLLAAHDAREKKLRHTKAAMNAANTFVDALGIDSDDNDGDRVELQPEHEVLHTELSRKRKDLLEMLNSRSVKSVLVDLNAAATRITKDNDPEKITLKEVVAQLRQFLSDQSLFISNANYINIDLFFSIGALMDKLDVDYTLINKAFNERILYFRQLQEISDTVAEVEWEGSVVDALLEATTEKDELDTEINKSRARHRYLDNLAKKKGDGLLDEEDESCILCRCEFIRGFITQCAHAFCEGCMKAWLTRKEGKTCPVCRVAIDPDTIERFTVKADEPVSAKPTSRPTKGEPVPRSRRKISYNMIDNKLFSDINSMESFGDYGSKIQTLVRHLLYLKNTDTGAKSIVFSAWADSLLIMERALRSNGIRCLRIDQKSKGESAAKRFKSDPEILVLLLHGERENAGLNITCASRVFLLESVVHHGFEIQAIARIDRMGQTRRTEVFCYYAEDTVERNILDLAARQGLSLYTTENSAGSLNVSALSTDADTKIVDSPKKVKKKIMKGDFIFKMDDMLAILFPHMYEEIEFLIPEDEEMESPSTSQAEPLVAALPLTSNGVDSDVVAGPSRLSSSSTLVPPVTTSSTAASLSSTITTAGDTTSTTTTSATPSTTTTSSSTITTTTPLLTTTTITSASTGTTNTAANIVTTTSVIAVTPTLAPATGTPAAGTSKGFFQNTGAVAGVFTVVGLIILALLIALITNIIRRRRAKQFDREVEEAAAEAAKAPAPIFLDDDGDDYYNPQQQQQHTGYSPSNGYSASNGYGGVAEGYSDVSSHGTYSQPPLSQETYGMREMGPAPGELYSGAAGVGVARARSTRDGAFATGLQEGATPYPAFAGPGAYQSGAYGAGGGGANADLLDATGMGVGAGVGAGGGLGRGMSLNHHSIPPHPAALATGYTGYDLQSQPGYYPNPYPQQQQQDLSRNTSAYTGTTLASSSSPPPKEQQSYGAHYASRPGAVHEQEEGEQDAYGGYMDEPQHPDALRKESVGSYYDEDEEEGEGRGARVLKVANE